MKTWMLATIILLLSLGSLLMVQKSKACTFGVTSSACCGCGLAKPFFMDTCGGSFWWGDCEPTGHSSCACADGGGDTGGGGGGGGGGGTGGGGSDSCAGVTACGVCGNPPCCVPVCNANGTYCGQDSGCGYTCPDSNTITPEPPKQFIGGVYDGTDGKIVIERGTTTATVAFTWETGTRELEIQIYPVGTSCAHPDAVCVTQATSQITFTPKHPRYTIRARSVNTYCDGPYYSEWGDVNIQEYDVVGDVEGQVFIDPDNTAVLSGGVCRDPLAPGVYGTVLTPDEQVPITVTQGDIQVSATPTVQYYPTLGYGVHNVHEYDLQSPFSDSGANLVSIDPPPGYTCSCPAGCVYSGIDAPSDTNLLNFYLTEASDPWFQVTGGPVAAWASSGTAIYNPVSQDCTLPNCKPYFITSPTAGSMAGYVMTGGGTVDLSIDSGVQNTNLDEPNRRHLISGTSTVRQESFAFFKRQFAFPANPVNDFPNPDDITKPTDEPANPDAGAYYQNSDVTITNPWTINAGESYTIFIDGDLTINDTITLDPNGFLAFIVTGDITVDPSVGTATLTSTTPQVAGFFMADGFLRLPSRGPLAGGDLKFVGEGTFVGWDGVILERSFNNTATGYTNHDLSPTEVFIYNPSLKQLAPNQLKSALFSWREVRP